MTKRRMLRFVVLLVVVIAVCGRAWAGPPFVTDDPEPVAYQHWEVYLASQIARIPDAWTGAVPQVEVNYGALPDLQLHAIVPTAFVNPDSGVRAYGLGDVELGSKFRFIQETDQTPQIGVFLLAEVPTGDPTLRLGNGSAQYFLPIWLQKSWGRVTVYGGGGYWIDTGQGNPDFWQAGAALQWQVLDALSVGAEIYVLTPQAPGVDTDTRGNLGAIWDLSGLQHVMASLGTDLQNADRLQAYVAYQLTFGPEMTGR